LRENAVAAGLAPDFSVLDEAWSERMLRQSADEILDSQFRERPDDVRALLESLELATQDDNRQVDLARSLMVAYQATREAGGAGMPRGAPVEDVEPELNSALAVIVAQRAAGEIEAGLQQWCREFLATPSGPERLQVAARFSVNIGRLKKSGAMRDRAKEVKERLLPGYVAQLVGEFYAPQRQLLEQCLRRLDAAYGTRKQAGALVDFADLEERAIALLEGDRELRDEIRGGFDEILMDELQDTNRLQWRLLDLLRRPGRFFAVGDINQSIYGFRNAEPRVFDGYRTALAASGGRIDQLRDNHRSRPEILTAVARILDGQTGIEPRALTAKREYPSKAEPCVEWMVGQGDDAVSVEAKWIAGRILELRGTLLIGEPGKQSSADFRDIAILVRALGSLEPIERALDALRIPYLVTGGRTFFEAREARDLRHLLALLANPPDQVSLVGVLRSPLVGVSDEAILRWSRSHFGALPDDLPAEERERLEDFQNHLDGLRAVADAWPADRLLAEFVDRSGYVEGLTGRERANIEKFLALVRNRQQSQPQALARLLDDIDSLRDTQAEPEAPPPEAGNVVRVMTIHAAKGLEFPVVFVPALQRGQDWRRPVVIFSAERGFGAKWRHPVTGEGQSDAVHAILQDELKDREEAEENRLLYVAMTRAKEHLVLSSAEGNRSGKWAKMVSAAFETPSAGLLVRAVRTDSIPPPEPASLEDSADGRESLLLRPVASGQYDSTAAVTSIALFHACPRKYYLSRYLGFGDSKPVREPDAFKTPDEAGPDATEIGLQTHAILAGNPPPKPHPEAAALAARFFESELGRRATRANRVQREFDFLFSLDDVVLRGQIDLWFEEGGELILVDYKTDRLVENIDSYALQLRLYALALERFHRRPDRAFLHFLRGDRTVPVGLSEPELAEAVSVVRAFREAQSRVLFPLTIGRQCQRCTFYANSCPAGRSGDFKVGKTEG
jgi:ATP-dependent exoDNAse (exonuclease V) beta subunit